MTPESADAVFRLTPGPYLWAVNWNFVNWREDSPSLCVSAHTSTDAPTVGWAASLNHRGFELAGRGPNQYDEYELRIYSADVQVFGAPDGIRVRDTLLKMLELRHIGESLGPYLRCSRNEALLLWAGMQRLAAL